MELEVWPLPTHHDALHLRSKSPLVFPSRSLSQSSPSLARPVESTAYPGSLSLCRTEGKRKSLSYGRLSPIDGFFQSITPSISTGLNDGQLQSQSQEGLGKTLRRKNAASNLNQAGSSPAQMGTLIQSPNAYQYGYYPGSTTSSPPPPLSPSYSPSALSEQFPELSDEYGCPMSPVSPLDASHCEGWTGKQIPCKLLDAFRDRLDRFPEPESPDIVEFHGHSRARSDSALFKPRRARKPPATTTVIHQGTSFDILNPHDSLDFAHIVSYIDDVDSHSAGHHQRDSYLNSAKDTNVIEEDPTEAFNEIEVSLPNVKERTHDDLVGDSPHHPMPSISERLEGNDAESVYSRSTNARPLSRPLSMVRPWTARTDTDLGEPGPPIYCDEDPHDFSPAQPPPPSSTSQNSPIDPIALAALYDIGRLPAQGKGTDNPTAIIYSDHPRLRKKQSSKRNLSSSPTSFSFSPSTAAATASSPLRRLRGMAQTLRRKTFQRPKSG